MKSHFSLPIKSLAIISASLLLIHGVRAQETLALDEAQKIAQKLAEVPSTFGDQAFAIDVDRDKPVGLKGGEAGLVVLPVKGLTTDTLVNAGKTVVPVAQLWTYKVTLANSGTPVEKAKLRIITVGEGDKTRDVQLFLIGVVKAEQGAPELVIYGKGGEPVLHVPLGKLHEIKQELPIQLSGRQTGDASATLTLDLVGQFSADVGVVKAEE
jgi:hypothetical protein